MAELEGSGDQTVRVCLHVLGLDADFCNLFQIVWKFQPAQDHGFVDFQMKLQSNHFFTVAEGLAFARSDDAKCVADFGISNVSPCH